MLYIFNHSCSFVKLKTVEKNKADFNFENFYQLSFCTEKPKFNMCTLGLLVGTNPRYEGYLLNLNLRQRFLKGNFKLLTIGPALDLTFSVSNLGSTIHILKSIGEGTHTTCQDIKNANFPMLITNMEFYKRSDANVLKSVLKYVNISNAVWSGFNVLSSNLSSNGIYSMNKFLHVSSDDLINFWGLYSLNVSLNSISKIKNLTELYLLKILGVQTEKFQNSFFINQSINSRNNSFYDKVKIKMVNSYFYLPISIIYEDNETYLNTQGIIKRVGKLLNFKKDVKTNWQLTRKLYSSVNSLTFYNNLKDNSLIQFDCINVFNFKNYFNFQYFAIQTLTSLSYYLIKQNSPVCKSFNTFFKKTKIKILNTKIKYWLDDFFNINGRDSFSYNSSLLIGCSKVIRSSSTNFF
jgi:Molybdopterin oxidoreductase